MPEVEITREQLDRFMPVDLATLWTALGHEYRGPSIMDSVRSYRPGTRIVGRARTLRYLPPRRKLNEAGQPMPFPWGRIGPEQQAMMRCNPGDVLVIDSIGKLGSGNIGDVKALTLKERGASGIVSDGSLRDVAAIQDYGMTIFAGGRTASGPTGILDEYEENVVIQCGGVRVEPGDVIVAEDDGVLVIPQDVALHVLEYAEEYQTLEGYIKELAARENVNPLTYYPPNDTLRARYRQEKLGQG